MLLWVEHWLPNGVPRQATMEYGQWSLKMKDKHELDDQVIWSSNSCLLARLKTNKQLRIHHTFCK